MTQGNLYMVMDDTNNLHSLKDIAEFEKVFDPAVLAESKARTKAIFDEVFGLSGDSRKAVA